MNESQYEKALREFTEVRLAKSDRMSELSIERIKLNNLITEMRDREQAYRRLNDDRKDDCIQKANDLSLEVELITKQIYSLRSEINDIDQSCKRLTEIKFREDNYSPIEAFRRKIEKEMH